MLNIIGLQIQTVSVPVVHFLLTVRSHMQAGPRLLLVVVLSGAADADINNGE